MHLISKETLTIWAIYCIGVNHIVWFGQGLFHTNTVEGLWSQIKRLTKNFSGITFSMVEKLESNGVNIKNYFDAWICYALFLRNVEKNKYLH